MTKQHASRLLAWAEQNLAQAFLKLQPYPTQPVCWQLLLHTLEFCRRVRYVTYKQARDAQGLYKPPKRHLDTVYQLWHESISRLFEGQAVRTYEDFKCNNANRLLEGLLQLLGAFVPVKNEKGFVELGFTHEHELLQIAVSYVPSSQEVEANTKLQQAVENSLQALSICLATPAASQQQQQGFMPVLASAPEGALQPTRYAHHINSHPPPPHSTSPANTSTGLGYPSFIPVPASEYPSAYAGHIKYHAQGWESSFPDVCRVYNQHALQPNSINPNPLGDSIYYCHPSLLHGSMHPPAVDSFGPAHSHGPPNFIPIASSGCPSLHGGPEESQGHWLRECLETGTGYSERSQLPLMPEFPVQTKTTMESSKAHSMYAGQAYLTAAPPIEPIQTQPAAQHRCCLSDEQQEFDMDIEEPAVMHNMNTVDDKYVTQHQQPKPQLLNPKMQPPPTFTSSRLGTLSSYPKLYFPTVRPDQQPDVEVFNDWKLGEGTCGTVYGGTWWGYGAEGWDRDVAIKAFDGWTKGHMSKEECDAACRKEYWNVTSLSTCLQHSQGGCKHVVTALSMAEWDQVSCIVYDLCKGGSVQGHLRQHGALSEPEVKDIMRDVAVGLEALHRHRLVHGDLKPNNILLMGNGAAKIADFGLSRYLYGERLYTGSLVGTEPYMAPEIYRHLPTQKAYMQGCGWRPDVQFSFEADMWSAGAVALELLTGRTPLYTEDEEHQGIRFEDGIGRRENVGHWLAKLYPGLSWQAKEFIEDLMALEPNRRLTAQGMISHPYLA